MAHKAKMKRPEAKSNPEYRIQQPTEIKLKVKKGKMRPAGRKKPKEQPITGVTVTSSPTMRIS